MTKCKISRGDYDIFSANMWQEGLQRTQSWDNVPSQTFVSSETSILKSNMKYAGFLTFIISFQRKGISWLIYSYFGENLRALFLY